MQIEYRKWFSNALNQEMALKIYGNAGKPVIVFPTEEGRFYDFEDFGMVEACQSVIESGKIKFFTVDSIDSQSWANDRIPPAERAKRHEDYDRYVMNELVPFVGRQSNPSIKKLYTLGASMGGYHASNFFFRRPDVFDGMIALSAMFQVRHFIGDYMDDRVYFHSPLHYLANLTDPGYLNQYRQSQIVVCVGRGLWEAPMLADTFALKNILEEKKVPCWIDVWGYDADHDWQWWRKQLPYFLEHLFGNPQI
jgi:esterase/lipase superfamily enzyme